MRVSSLAVIGVAMAALLGTGLLAGCAGGTGGTDLVQPVYRCTSIPTQPALAETAGVSARYFEGVQEDAGGNVGASCAGVGLTVSGAPAVVTASGGVQIHNSQGDGSDMADVSVTVVADSLAWSKPDDWTTDPQTYADLETYLGPGDENLGLFTTDELATIGPDDWAGAADDDLLTIAFNGSATSAEIPLILNGGASPGSLCALSFSAQATSSSKEARLAAVATVLLLSFDLSVCADIGTATEETAWAKYTLDPSAEGFNADIGGGWGWYHVLSADDTYVFDLIAGQTTDVGTVIVTRESGAITSIDYAIDQPGWVLGVVQAYVGSSPPTNNPGGFAIKSPDPIPGYATTYTLSGLSETGSFFAAHADVWSVPSP